MKMKKMLAVALACGMTLSMAVPTFAADDPVTLVYAEVNPEDSLMGQTANAFKEKVEELTEGSVKVDIQYAGVLGDEATVLDTMIGGGGTVDVARVATFSLTNYGAKEHLFSAYLTHSPDVSISGNLQTATLVQNF